MSQVRVEGGLSQTEMDEIAQAGMPAQTDGYKNGSQLQPSHALDQRAPV
jgi:hypothetical protein